MKITVTVKLAAPRPSIYQSGDDHFVVSLTEGQETPMAQYRLKQLLAEHFQVDFEAIHLISGQRQLVKLYDIEGGELPERFARFSR